MGRRTLTDAFARALAPARLLPVLATAVALAEALVLGRVLRSRKDLDRRLDEQARELERNRAGHEHAVVLAQRTQIALELHDVVAHDVSVMVVQAGAARRALHRDPDAAVGALGAVEATGREALTEMRRLLGILRPDGQDAGLEVDLRVEGEPGPLAPGVDLTAFRLVQEGLTNALEDGGRGQARVTLRWSAQRLEVEVASRSAGAGGGRGLVGMRERVALCGGELRAGPVGRGFVVRARLPRERGVSSRALAAA